MKRLFLIIALFTLSLSLSAQRNRVRDAEYFPRNEIYVQYGAPTVMELSTNLNKSFSSKNMSGTSDNYKFSGVGGIGYDFYLSPGFALGIYGGVGYTSADMFLESIDDDVFSRPIKMYRSEVVSYTAQLAGSYVYWHDGPMQLSGALYLGVCWMDESIQEYDHGHRDLPQVKPNDRLRFSYHLTALKFRFGEAIGGFAELGFGYRGLVNVGLSIKI